MVRWWVVVMLSMAGCKRAEPPAPAAEEVVEALAQDEFPVEWETFSNAGSATVVSRRAGERCEVSCSRAAARVWKRDECLAQEADRRFVTDDCALFVRFRDAPLVESSVANTVVGTVVKADGSPVPLRLWKLADLSAAKRSQSGRWFAWLEGTLEHPGAGPHYAADGAGVEFTSLDGRAHHLTFAVLASWVDERSPEVAAVAAAPSDDALYMWEDGSGATLITPLSAVPPKLRAKAKRVESEVSVLGDPTPRAPALLPWASADGLPRRGGGDGCARARAQIAQVERDLAEVDRGREDPSCWNRTVRSESGGQVLDLAGARACAAANESASASRTQRRAQLSSQLDAARDSLRRAQADGCR